MLVLIMVDKQYLLCKMSEFETGLIKLFWISNKTLHQFIIRGCFNPVFRQIMEFRGSVGTLWMFEACFSPRFSIRSQPKNSIQQQQEQTTTATSTLFTHYNSEQNNHDLLQL